MRKPPAALRQFLRAFDPAIGRLFLAARAEVLALAPEADELIYDAYNAVAAGYTFSGRLKEGFCHIAAYREHVNLGFDRGATLPDPDHILVGKGARIRHVRIDAIEDLRRPAMQRMIRAAIAAAEGLISETTASAQSKVAAMSARKRRPAVVASKKPAKRKTPARKRKRAR